MYIDQVRNIARGPPFRVVNKKIKNHDGRFVLC
jgi:hypothetical protein